MRALFFLMIALFTFANAKAQDPIAKKPIDTSSARIDTIKPQGYVNMGKIAGRKAFRRSLLFPGLGQIYNYGLVVDDVKSGAVEGRKIAQKTYIVAKIAGIYTGGTLLALSYVDNRAQYKRFLSELQYRQLNNNRPNPDGDLQRYADSEALTVAKNVYKRNSQVVLISMVGLYALNALDAYITARLKYFNVDDTLTFKVSPSLINSPTMYGYQTPIPSLKFSFQL